MDQKFCLQVLPPAYKRFFLSQSFPSFQNDDMRIIWWAATKVIQGPV